MKSESSLFGTRMITIKKKSRTLQKINNEILFLDPLFHRISIESRYLDAKNGSEII